jgi:uncharacterized protein YbbC (DUF1343 family)
MTILWFAMMTALGPPQTAPHAPAVAKAGAPALEPVRCGIDVLAAEGFRPLRGLKVGLITNHTGMTQDGKSTIDVLFHAPDVKLVKLFSPEHGIRGEVDAVVPDGKDAATGLPIVSLYGNERKPRPQDLLGLDALVFDIQDVGARFYTYISTLGLALEAAAESEKQLFVLDRPNPIGGRVVSGPVRDEEFTSFVAYHALPVRHGMTVGELALLYNTERKLGASLSVIRCSGWRRDDLFDRTGLVWINPSPNMRSLTGAWGYSRRQTSPPVAERTRPSSASGLHGSIRLRSRRHSRRRRFQVRGLFRSISLLASASMRGSDVADCRSW